MFERPASGERAVLVQLDLGQDLIDERLSEFKLLVLSAGASVEAVVQGRRSAPDAKLFAGSGKVQEIGEALRVMNEYLAANGKWFDSKSKHYGWYANRPTKKRAPVSAG